MPLSTSGPLQPSYPLAFDHQATTPCDQEVLDAMKPYWNAYWGNASSRTNRSGLRAAAAVSVAREQLASCLKVRPENLIFTSGATEANNLALLGHARAKAREMGKPGHLITIATEHHAVLDPLRHLQSEGFRLTEITPGSDGLLSTDQLVGAFETKHTAEKPKMIVANTIKGKGVSFMENNNEWHHNILTKSKYELALAELEG